jgi:hypothetical protein
MKSRPDTRTRLPKRPDATSNSQRGRSARQYPIQRSTISLAVKSEGVTMGNLANALQQLRAERRVAQLQVEKLEVAISAIESLNGAGASRTTYQPTGITSTPTRIISAASRRKMALAQRARWARAKKESKPVLVSAPTKTSGSSPVAKRTMSAAARRKIAAFQRARWAKLRAGQQKKAA